MGYKKAIVFFIDILGTRDRHDFDKLLNINQIFHKSLEAYQLKDQNHTVFMRKVYTFSDCAYIIYDFEQEKERTDIEIAKLMKVALYNTEKLIRDFLIEGFICRGGVTYGEVYYELDRSLFFGPAINRAYFLESKVAKFPRIVVDENINQAINKLENFLYEEAINNHLPKFMLDNYNIVNGSIIEKDPYDDEFHLNYLNSFRQGHVFDGSERLLDSTYKLIKSSIADLTNKLRNSKDENHKKEIQKIMLKYNWLQDYIDNSIPNRDSGVVMFEESSN